MLLVTCITSVYYIQKVRRTDYFVNYMYAAFFILFCAGSIWMLDREGVACSPQSALQGHAMWHILTAASIFFIYLYYRSGTLKVVPERGA